MTPDLLYYLWDGKVSSDGKKYGMYKISNERWEIMWSWA